MGYNETSITITLSLINYNDHASTTAVYRLPGYTNDWTEIDDKNQIKLSDLSTGSHSLDFKTICPDLSEGKLHTLMITVTKPFYLTAWFISLVAFSLLAIGYLINSLVTRRHVLQQKRLLEIERAVASQRKRLANDLHDEIGSGLSKINFLSSHSSNMASDRILRVGDISRQLMTGMRDMLWALNEDNDNLDDLLARIRTSTEMLLSSSQYEYTIASNHRLNIPISGILRRNIDLILKESLNNILKHANGSLVIISLTYKEDILELIIEDDGNGTPSELGFAKNSFGLKSIKNRCESMNGHFSVRVSSIGGIAIVANFPLTSVSP